MVSQNTGVKNGWTYPGTDMWIIQHVEWETLWWIDSSLWTQKVAQERIENLINPYFLWDGSLDWTMPEQSRIARELWFKNSP
jgi:hypothetical protein